eukprot:2564732-Lingulodinium_polyedra.AAC.1
MALRPVFLHLCRSSVARGAAGEARRRWHGGGRRQRRRRGRGGGRWHPWIGPCRRQVECPSRRCLAPATNP